MLNPELVKACGEGSSEMLSQLVDAIGGIQACLVDANVLRGFINMNGVTMPLEFSTDEDNLEYVSECIKNFYMKTGGVYAGQSVEIYRNRFQMGDVSLCVPESV